jgi:hypothetical protein
MTAHALGIQADHPRTRVRKGSMAALVFKKIRFTGRRTRHNSRQAIEQKATEGTEKIRCLCYLRFLLFKILVRLSTIMRFGGSHKKHRRHKANALHDHRPFCVFCALCGHSCRCACFRTTSSPQMNSPARMPRPKFTQEMPDETTNDANNTNQDIPFVGVGSLSGWGRAGGKERGARAGRPDTRQRHWMNLPEGLY